MLLIKLLIIFTLVITASSCLQDKNNDATLFGGSGGYNAAETENSSFGFKKKKKRKYKSRYKAKTWKQKKYSKSTTYNAKKNKIKKSNYRYR